MQSPRLYLFARTISFTIYHSGSTGFIVGLSVLVLFVYLTLEIIQNCTHFLCVSLLKIDITVPMYEDLMPLGRKNSSVEIILAPEKDMAVRFHR